MSNEMRHDLSLSAGRGHVLCNHQTPSRTKEHTQELGSATYHRRCLEMHPPGQAGKGPGFS